eukprot:TRINITY_DN187_c0_g1_i5.p1 TRINITY_DN187_c0_g1~~TRINITY_DN187_c0_g1_i5.p1  ORF type:complete len:403 (-),score=156.40 TRINITY_DN187_c0_g1_i5:125-1333(-)
MCIRDRLYDLLGVAPDANQKDIKKAFYKIARTEHPDKGGDAEKFKLITQAYDILQDKDKREAYDRYGMDGIKEGMSANGGSPFDVFEQFFGMGGKQKSQNNKQKKGKPQLKELQVTLEDVYSGKTFKKQHSRKKMCEACEGLGGKNVQECKTCKGRGMVEKLVMLGPGMYQQSAHPCSECKGQGKIINDKDKCKNCKGNKVLEEKKTLDVVLEPGTPHEFDIVLYGECDEAPNTLPGDLHFRVMIQDHPEFERKGADLFYKKKITLKDALCGCNFEVTHLDQKKLLLSTIPGDIISLNEKKVVTGKGMPFHKDAMSHGNLIIIFDVVFPVASEITESHKEQLQKILPGQYSGPLKKINKVEYLNEFHETDLNPNAEGGKHKDQDEEDDGRGGYQQRVQCNQQ